MILSVTTTKTMMNPFVCLIKPVLFFKVRVFLLEKICFFFITETFHLSTFSKTSSRINSIWLLVIIMSHTSFRVNLQSIVCLNIKELLPRSRCHIWSLSDSNGIQTHNYLVRKRTPNHLASVCLRTMWLWVRIPLLSLKFNKFDSLLRRFDGIPFLIMDNEQYQNVYFPMRHVPQHH